MLRQTGAKNEDDGSGDGMPRPVERRRSYALILQESEAGFGSPAAA
jgi:hypothetical protein